MYVVKPRYSLDRMFSNDLFKHFGVFNIIYPRKYAIVFDVFGIIHSKQFAMIKS